MHYRYVALTASALLLLAGSPALAQSTPVPSPPTPIPAGPSETAPPAPSPAPIPVPSATPNPYHYIVTPAPATQPVASDAPTITEIDLNDQTILAPGPLMLRVVTSASVSRVVARALGHEIAIPQIGAGLFGVVQQIPDVPDFLRNQVFDVEFVASTADGRVQSVHVPMTIK